ncbi:class I SAM-dependent methyltransferase [Amycolatopsis sp. NPDC059027]|uniref:class I SAM-dependent methyltransferase n=1 Tax=unclassified Amycolatopsis TaxID=2618356 RepID=UPI00367159E9
MSFSGTKQQTSQGQAREALVKVQYEDATAAANYAASFEGWGPVARYHWSRRHIVGEALKNCPGGALLDIGCGPGAQVRYLLDERPGDFRITACDQSFAMIEATAERVGPAGGVRLSVADIEDMPFGDDSFDVVLAMGVLEYVDAGNALREVARVLRPGGLLVATMLNPLSPYRLFEWGVFWPARRVAGFVERWCGVPPHRRHAARRTGIHAVRPARLRKLLWQSGLSPKDVAFYDVTVLVPPFDRLVRRWARGWRHAPETTVSRGARRWLGTAYLMTARQSVPS